MFKSNENYIFQTLMPLKNCLVVNFKNSKLIKMCTSLSGYPRDKKEKKRTSHQHRLLHHFWLWLQPLQNFFSSLALYDTHTNETTLEGPPYHHHHGIHYSFFFFLTFRIYKRGLMGVLESSIITRN